MIVFEEIADSFGYADGAALYNDGNKRIFEEGTREFALILDACKEMTGGARQMPAYGVSLNDYTVADMQTGLWVEFIFGETSECDGMPFEKLLIKAERESAGFNLIRYNSRCGYDGRCFYLDLVNKNMSEFCDILLNI